MIALNLIETKFVDVSVGFSILPSLALFDSFSRSFKTIVPENFPHVSCSRHLLLFHFSSFNQWKLKILFGFGGKSHRWHGCSCHCLWIHKIWSNYVNSIYFVTPRDWRYSWRRYIFIVHAIAVIVKWKSEGKNKMKKQRLIEKCLWWMAETWWMRRMRRWTNGTVLFPFTIISR